MYIFQIYHNSVFSCCVSHPVFENFDKKKTTDLVNNVCKQEAYSIVVRTVSDCVHGLRTVFYHPSLVIWNRNMYCNILPSKARKQLLLDIQ